MWIKGVDDSGVEDKGSEGGWELSGCWVVVV